MKNRSFSYWMHESFKILGLSLGASFLYSLLMGGMRHEVSFGAPGIQMVKTILADGFLYFVIMQVVFLARFALDAAQRRIPLCIACGETRHSVLVNQQLSVFIQQIATVLVILGYLFLIMPDAGTDSIWNETIAHPGWTVCVVISICLMPLAISQAGCAVTILTEGRSATWSSLVTIFVTLFLAMFVVYVGVHFIENLFGNWLVVGIIGGISAVIYVAGFLWLLYLMKNYRVSL